MPLLILLHFTFKKKKNWDKWQKPKFNKVFLADSKSYKEISLLSIILTNLQQRVRGRIHNRNEREEG